MLFSDFKAIIDHINSRLFAFSDTFGNERKQLAGLGKRPTKGILFTYDASSNRNWAINEGGGTEIQYHIGFNIDEKTVYYGLGFNTQYVPFANEKSMVDYAKPYMNAFLLQEESIGRIVPHYHFVIGNRQDLLRPRPNHYILFGNDIDAKSNNQQIEIDDNDLETVIHDLQLQFEAYKLIFIGKNKNLPVNPQTIDIVNLLRYKKQIILQGPPGTGKTKLAKELAAELIERSVGSAVAIQLSDAEFVSLLEPGLQIPTVAGNITYTVVSVEVAHRKVVLKKSTESEAATSFDTIRRFMKDDLWEQSTSNNDDRRAAAIAKYFSQQREPAPSGQKSQCKIVQFHPSYSYEDFVRGIVAKPNEDGDGVLYEAEDKLIAKLAKKALNNYKLSHTVPANSSKLVSDQNDLDRFVRHVQDSIADSADQKYPLTDDVYLFSSDATRFKYKGDNWVAHSKGLNMKYSELQKIIAAGVTERAQVRNLHEVEELTRQHATYFYNTYKKFQEFVANNPAPLTPAAEVMPLKNYVLIIDEINRANLSSVLGELIYALEYREEPVESLYATDGDNKLILPPNLYIIGTMNTADRSVGHIDYAIRRRFAFVDVLPEVLKSNDQIVFHEQLFHSVASLFIKNLEAYIADKNVVLIRSQYLSQEFMPKDIWLGHSYFIQRKVKDSNGNETLVPASINLRVKYEIIPILEEYIRDGVLKDSEEVRIIISELESTLA